MIKLKCDPSLKKIDVKKVKVFKDAGIHSQPSEGLEKSLEKHGFRFPLNIWFDEHSDGWSIDGNGRVATILQNELETENGDYLYPYVEIQADDKKHAVELLFEAEKKYNKWLNREAFNDLAEFIEMDFEVMKMDYEVFVDDSEPEEETELEAKEDDYQIPDVVHTDIVKGDLFEFVKGDLKHRLSCGDSTEVDSFEKLFDGELADMVVTDPPYNVDYTGKTKDSLKIENDKMDDGSFYQFLYDFYVALGSFTKKGGAWYVWHASSEIVAFAKDYIDSGLLLKQQLIWLKQTLVMGRQDYHWKHEPCLYGWKEGAAHNWYTDRKQTTILEFDRPSRNGEHPTMKPVPLIAYQIGNSSKKGDIVADGFGGSGTTMVACHELDRNCYMQEYDEKYCQVIVDRMLKLDSEIKLFRNGEEVTNKYRERLLLIEQEK